jgi:Resolvase, N terminal domain
MSLTGAGLRNRSLPNRQPLTQSQDRRLPGLPRLGRYCRRPQRRAPSKSAGQDGVQSTAATERSPYESGCSSTGQHSTFACPRSTRSIRLRTRADAIQQYAARRGLTVVRTYADEGKSGLSLEGRDALKRHIDDVQEGSADFSTILVYDVNEWGAFKMPTKAPTTSISADAPGSASTA